ncbi:uncharacterized protein LOC124666887 [Lolium rigidum]|uniref:uncharacterized protein LOC124666887 n=1 Tax=Lolium rigidum TaxID=89674 RepID=UPI001F5C5FCA|nr:uncharacterized protein LOC124666887 [Lolium rigidum]
MEAAQSTPWSDLQPELLGLVLRRLPSLADRVRLRAVCRPWRSNSMSQPLPLPFPWLTLPGGTFLSIPANEIHRIPIPDGACVQGSIDNWLFLMHKSSMDNRNVCSLMNPFSKATLELPDLVAVWKRQTSYYSHRKPIFYKLVVPSPLDSSPDSPVAALIMDDGNSHILCISQPPIATSSLRARSNKDTRLYLIDVVFFNRKLYGLDGSGKLYIIDLDNDLGISSIECIIDALGDIISGIPQHLPGMVYMSRKYLVECGGKLLMVVFEADLCSSPNRWRSATELGGHALFVGQRSSKSLPARECSGYHEDCIYFMFDYDCRTSSANPLHDSGVYNIRNGTIAPLMSGTSAASLHRVGQWRPTWFFPPEAV